MDIRCTKCGEPWDLDCLHDEATFRYPDKPWYPNGEYSQAAYDPILAEVRDDFRKRGCVALGGSRCDGSAGPLSAAIAAAAFELMGDDIDGVASMLDDAESMGLI